MTRRSSLAAGCVVLSVATLLFGCSAGGQADDMRGQGDDSASTGGAGGQAIGTGGTASGGAVASGGAISSGGSASGAGGTAANGGRGGAGGTANGGTSNGGTPGLGAWTTGYAATMFGNSAAGDCSAYADNGAFTDSTMIAGSACASNKTVTIDTYSSTVANDASYYGAPGDLSSIWSGAQCMCQNGGGTGTGDCTTPPSCPMENDCGKCVAVKCDPNGTVSVGGQTHDMYCDTSSYVVIEVIDACPHNHPTNVMSTEGWCTMRQAQHIDLSCSALGDISSLGTGIGKQGWLNVDVQIVPCSLGLGKHSL
jgi:hypothetical protein